LYNPNNCSWEASPVTTLLEVEVGRELASMLGFGRTPEQLADTWGHITSGGSIANLNAVLQTLTFSSSSDDPTVNATATSRTLTISVTDANSDGAGAGISTTTRDVTVAPAQDAPVLGGAGHTRSYTGNAAAITLEPALSIADVDDSQMSGASVIITAGLTAGDVLSASAVGGITVSYAPLTGTLTLSGTDSVANYRAVLRSVGFGSTSTSGARTITWQTTDANSDLAGAASSNVATTTIVITPFNSPPVARDDAIAISEDAVPNTVGGDVTPGTPGQDSDPDSADVLTVIAFRTGSEAAGSGAAGTVGGPPLAGSYGSLSLNSDGAYTYALDNTNAAVNALNSGDTLLEYFTYTIGDGRGGLDVAQLTITINGVTDAAGNSVPAIAAIDGNGAAAGQVTVAEAGLTSGGGTAETSTGSIALTAADGLAGVTVGGTPVSLAQLAVLAATPIVITTPAGTITLTGFTPTAFAGGVPTAGTLDFSYTLAVVQNTPSASENSDAVSLAIRDADGDSAAGTLTVRLVDDTPTAFADANRVSEGASAAPTTTTGNVFTGSAAGDAADRIGADTIATPVTAVGFGATAGSVGAPLAGAYGTLTLNADGSYAYTLDNNNPAVDALQAGDSLTEVFTYTITDGDGDSSSTTLTITITGVNDPQPLPESPPGIVAPKPPEWVFFDPAVPETIPRVPIPFQPILFVSTAVRSAQSERLESDPRSFGSDPRVVRQGNAEDLAIGAGLGFDPALFVQEAVRSAQGEGAFIDAIVNSRHGALSLSSDGRIPTPVLFHANAEDVVPPPARIAGGEATDIRVADASAAPTADSSLAPGTFATDLSWSTPDRLAAQSFSDQLRGAGAKLRPLSLRDLAAARPLHLRACEITPLWERDCPRTINAIM